MSYSLTILHRGSQANLNLPIERDSMLSGHTGLNAKAQSTLNCVKSLKRACSKGQNCLGGIQPLLTNQGGKLL